MRTHLIQKPQIEIVLLNTQHKPLRFTRARLELLQKLSVEFPDLPLLCFMDHKIRHVELGQIELWDIKMLSKLNTSF